MAEQQHKHRVGVLLFRIKCFGATEGSHVGGLDGGYFWPEKREGGQCSQTPVGRADY